MPDRYAPDIPFPAYAFVPGEHPHPVTDPRGHQFGAPEKIPVAFDPDRPMDCPDYLFAIDLFNAGYYWEAHEVWEALWLIAGRRGPVADFLKALIKLTAAGVKSREGSATGVRRHAERALKLLETIGSTASGDDRYGGLSTAHLKDVARQLIEHPPVDKTHTVSGRPVLSVRLTVERQQS